MDGYMSLEYIETGGLLSLNRLPKSLEDGGYRCWALEELEKLYSENTMKVVRCIKEGNRNRRIPSVNDIIYLTGLDRPNVQNTVYALKRREIIFNVTIPEILIHFNLHKPVIENIGIDEYKSKRPEHLYWLDPYVENEVIRYIPRYRIKRFRNPRARTVVAHWIALIEEDGRPCYGPLKIC